MVEQENKKHALQFLRMLSSQITANKTGKYDEIVENEPGSRVSSF
jgi:hypothetical protein